MNYRNIFRHIYERGRKAGTEFIVGMEHGNALPGKEGEQKLIDAYVAADAFSA